VHAAAHQPKKSRHLEALGGILYVEASHLALSKTENVSDRLVFKPVRLPLERLAFEIADGLRNQLPRQVGCETAIFIGSPYYGYGRYANSGCHVEGGYYRPNGCRSLERQQRSLN
jgi:hypothetical protein